LSSVTTGRGGRRRGAGRKPKPLIALVEGGTFSTTRHGRLLWTDDSLLEAAAARPGDDGLQRLAKINQAARERGGSRHPVEWFSRTLRGLKDEEAKVSESHEIEIVETWEEDERVIVARNLESDSVLMTLRTAALCPHCVSTALRGVLDQFEKDAKAG
jgi:hypothetical protein